MDLLVAISISVGIFSGLWGYISATFAISTWVGFVGCTSYYASGGKLKGFLKSILANMTGILWAMSIIIGSSKLPGHYWSYILTGIFSFVMCIQAKLKALDFIPGAFCGACATFGLNGHYELVIPALICGNILGYVSDLGGIGLHKLFPKKEKNK